MQPRIFQLYSSSSTAIPAVLSPTNSDWSPIIVPINPLDDDDETRYQEEEEALSFPSIRRSFAFDEWDDDEEEEEEDEYNLTHNGDGEEEDPRRDQEVVVEVIPQMVQGQTIYDATQAISSSGNLSNYDTYMTVIHLDDNDMKLFKNTTSSTSAADTTSFAETSMGDPYSILRSQFSCPGILRHSTTYRWGTGFLYLQNTMDDAPTAAATNDHLDLPLRLPNRRQEDIVGNDNESAEEVESSSMSTDAESSFPVPEFITVYKTE